MIFNNILETIGKTPLVRVNKLSEIKAQNLYLKLESNNPGGSIKDRPALNMIQQAEARKEITPGKTKLIEATSGNTGIGLAMVAAIKGYDISFTIADNMSAERIKILKAYGANVIFTPGSEGTVGAIKKAKELEATGEYHRLAQHDNPDNISAHKSTADEIWQDMEGKIDTLVCATGTGGTVTGTGKYLREYKSDLEIVVTEPAEAPILSTGKWAPHGIMATAPGMIPKTLDTNIYDKIISVWPEEAYQAARNLAKTEGILVGISSGAIFHIATKMATDPQYAGKNIVAIMPDSGERYLSTKLWEINA